MKKVLTIVGARPQFIKAAVVSRNLHETLESKSGLIKEVIVHTGQHFDHNMSEVFFTQLDIPKPLYNLGISGGGHSSMTGQMMACIEECVVKENPDLILVYGDTNSTLAGALVAAKSGIPLAHIEAGLRSFNMRMPEEVNRIVTDRLSTLLFCPSAIAVANLSAEGIPDISRAHNIPTLVQRVGDVMYDAVLYYLNINKDIFSHNKAPYGVATLHRQENVDDISRISSILSALNDIAIDLPIYFPIHPRTRKMLDQQHLSFSNIRFVEPIGYLEMIQLVGSSEIVFTDSGGLQKEAYFLKKPCITLRDETEWTELVEVGANLLCGANADAIKNGFHTMIAKKDISYRPIYGNGDAGQKIVDIIIKFLGI